MAAPGLRKARKTPGMTIRIGMRLTLPLPPHRPHKRRFGKLRHLNETPGKTDQHVPRANREASEPHAAADPAATAHRP